MLSLLLRALVLVAIAFVHPAFAAAGETDASVGIEPATVVLVFALLAVLVAALRRKRTPDRRVSADAT